MNKKISADYHDPQSGKMAKFEYTNVEVFSVDPKKVTQIYGICFLQDKMIVVKSNGGWSLPGGTKELNESIEEALKREIQEETNMEVLSWLPVGVQTVFEENKKPYYQLRAVCQVRPIGPFVSDPDGDVTEFKLIETSEYQQYFNWGEIGETIMTRARLLKKSLYRYKKRDI